MGSLLVSQISSPEEIVGNEKEPIMPVEGKQENGSHGDGFLPITAPSNGQQGAFFSSQISWLKVLAKETHWSFVFGVIVVYGISQGLGGGTWRVAVDYYWKDVQLVQPSAAQVYQGIIYTPWIVKPFWGLLTDVLPVAGYRRKPYLIFAGLLGLVSMLTLSLSQLHIAFALLAMTAGSAGVAIADVTIDACVAQNSIASPFLAAEMQSLCGLSSSIGALLGFSLSGVLIHAMGSQGVLGLLSIPSLLVLLVGVLIKESRVSNFSYNEIHQKFLIATKTMWSTLKCPAVWRPCLYMYFSLALALNIQEGMFYWYTDPKAGPSFSQETVGFIFSIGSVGSLLGVLLYQNILKDFPFRSLFFWAQLLTAFAGMLDLILVLRINLKLGMPDYFFVVVDECVSQMIGRIKWLPLLVLSSKLCPPGIEGTFFALLMSIDNMGLLSASWGGGLLLHIFSVTRREFGNLWIVILIRSLMRLLPLVLLFLVPGSDHNSSILPAETLGESGDMKDTKEIDVELASLVNNTS